MGDDNTIDAAALTGVLANKIRLQSQVEESPMKVGHSYSHNKEIVFLRIAEEADSNGCMISIGRSCPKHVMATGARDEHTFCTKVLYSNMPCSKVDVCDTYPKLVLHNLIVHLKT